MEHSACTVDFMHRCFTVGYMTEDADVQLDIRATVLCLCHPWNKNIFHVEIVSVHLEELKRITRF